MIWTKSEEELIKFLNELNTKPTSIKFELKYSRQQIEFLTIFCKQRCTGNYLHSKSVHLSSYQSSIAYSQALTLLLLNKTSH